MNPPLKTRPPGKLCIFITPGKHARLAVCLELIDEREKLEAFFLRHRGVFRGKVAIFQKALLWEVE